ncbi:hypothetical protein DFH08DRAFT_863443 [Mycena albidolilacea]|uniref:Uncharacterized protein n=1 Tax=Mycena albidolilacea TaxID=1033008 RepID=A0AAD7EST8_9AGAR|nr:hypothetical protein DFH08DRAFT_863443 [Mycena albidolilacea]
MRVVIYFISLFLGDSVDGEQEAFGIALGLGAGNNFLDRRVGDEFEELVLAGIVGDDNDSPRGSTDAEALELRIEVVVRDEQLVLCDRGSRNGEGKEGIGDALDASIELGGGQAGGSTGDSNSADRHCSKWDGVEWS